MDDDAIPREPETPRETAQAEQPVMKASRLRDLIAHAISQHKDIDAVAFERSAFPDRLGLNVRDVDGATWRVWVSRSPWSRPDGDSDDR